MPQTDKYTIRDLEPDAIKLLWTIKLQTGRNLGDLMSEAIFDWYEHLPEEDNDLISQYSSE